MLELLALAAAALPQSTPALAVETPTALPSPVKHGGVYHVRTGTVSHRSQRAAAFGAVDTIYDNTASALYFTGSIGPTGTMAGGRLTDSGGVPSTLNTYVSGVVRDSNEVTGFEFAYCDLDPAPQAAGWRFTFFESLPPCSSTAGVTPSAQYDLTGLPSGGCWFYDVDLTGIEFCLGGDGGDGAFQDDADFDSFGWSIDYIGTGTAVAGPLIAGDPAATDVAFAGVSSTEGRATYYNPLSNCAPAGQAQGSGFFSQDFFFAEDLGGSSGQCTSFGGYANSSGACGAVQTPFSSFYLSLESNAACTAQPGIGFGTTCAATPNSSGVAGACEALGDATAAADTLVLRASNLPTALPGVFGIFLHSTIDLSANPISAGQGVLCLGQEGRFDAPGQIKQAGPNGECELSTVLGEFSVASLPIANAPFSIAAIAGQTSYFGFWHRDVVGGQNVSNFTGTCGVTWQ